MRARHTNRIAQYIDPRRDWLTVDPAAIYPPAAYDVEPNREGREQPEIKRERERISWAAGVTVCVLILAFGVFWVFKR